VIEKIGYEVDGEKHRVGSRDKVKQAYIERDDRLLWSPYIIG